MNTQDINKRIRLIMKLRTMGIGDTNVLGAIEKVPREYFVPEAVIDQAWDDIALPIGRGQTISQPFVGASMTAALELSDRDTVLEIGTGCGYQTAILCRLVRRVYTIERHKPLLDDAVVRFEQLKIRNVTAIAADGMQGWPTMRGAEAAQFDKIIVTAAARDKPPQALLDQLKVGGILIIPVGESGAQVLRRYKKESDDTYAMRDLMDVRFVPLLPDLAGNVEAVA